MKAYYLGFFFNTHIGVLLDGEYLFSHIEVLLKKK